MAHTITVGGHEYAVGRLTARQQLHVSRRVAPLVATLGLSLGPEVVRRIRAAEQGASLGITVDEIMGTLGPLATVLSSMSDESVDYVIATCLNAVTRRQKGMGEKGGDLWAPAMREDRVMFDDIGMPAMVRLCVAVMAHNLGDFWKELLDAPDSTSS